MMETGEVKQYTKYGVGEILLVTVGILIALQINNWNSSKILKQKEIIILQQIKNELQLTLDTEINPAKAYYQKQDTLLKRVVKFYKNPDLDSPPGYNFGHSEILTLEDSLPDIFNVLFEWHFVINTSAFENLKSVGMDQITNDSLRVKISTIYSNVYPQILLTSQRVIHFLEDQLRPLINDHYKLLQYRTQHDLDYFRSNHPFINRINWLHRDRSWVLKTLNESIPRIEILMKEIDQELKRLES